MLAVPQPQSLVLVDQTSATTTRYDVPGFNSTVVWSPGGRAILLTTEERPGGSLVNVDDGSVTRVPYGSSTAFAPDGTAVQVAAQSSELRRYPPGGDHPQSIQGVLNMSGTLQNVAPTVNDTAVAGIHDQSSWSIPRGPEERGGVLVVGATSGDPLALLPMHNYAYIYQSATLCWLDDHSVLIHIAALSPTGRSHLVAWNYSTGDLKRASDVPGNLIVSVASNVIG